MFFRLLLGSAAPAQSDAGEAPPKKHPVGCAFAPFAARGIPRPPLPLRAVGS